MRRKPKKVIAAMPIANTPGRRRLGGLLRYANSGHPWNLQLLTDPQTLTPQAIADAEKSGVDGIIAIADKANVAALAASPIPTVVMCDGKYPSLHGLRSPTVFVSNDEIAGGETVAEFFRSHGTYASYGFVPDEAGRIWSRLRERGFRQHLGRFSQRVHTFGGGDLAAWLRKLPKPAAVMAAYDFRAKDVVETCNAAGIDVPRQVSVVGMDNDELICDYTSPTITSLTVDHEAYTYAAAKLLDELMRSRRKRGQERKILTGHKQVVERESTAYMASSAHIVTKAMDFIAENACRGITVEDVISHLGVSRRLAYLRFAQYGRQSIRREIEKCRLEKVRYYLKSSRLPVGRISILCGYENPQRLMYVFKSSTGMTMTEYRRAHSANSCKGMPPPVKTISELHA